MSKPTAHRRPAKLDATRRLRSRAADGPGAQRPGVESAEPDAPEIADYELEPAPSSAAASPDTRSPRTSKLDQLVGLLQRLEGATIAQLSAATGWQAHSVRGALAGALKKRSLVVMSEKIDGVRVYRLPAPSSEAQP